MMKKQAIVLGIVLGCGAAAAIAEVDSVTSDYDLKYYSAAGCGAQKPASSTVGKGGAIMNSGTSNNNLTCPVIIDRIFSLGTRDYWLKVYRAAGAGPMTCYLSISYGGSVTTTNQTVATTGVESTVSFTGYYNRPDAASLGCITPPVSGGVQSGIIRYLVQERP